MNRVHRERLRIVVDARPLSHPQAGGFRAYTRALVQGFSAATSETSEAVQLIWYLDRPLPPEIEAGLPPNTETRLLSLNRITADLLLFPRQIRRDRPDLVHGTANYLPSRLPAPQTIAIHDAFGIRTYPWEHDVRRNFREWLMNRYWRVMTWLSARRARRIVAPSDSAARELRDALKLPEERFAVVNIGVSPSLLSNNPHREANTVLAIASADPRKNSTCLYHALRCKEWFPVPPFLWLVCSHDKAAQEARRMLEHAGITDFHCWIQPDNRTLSDLYRRATAFVWTSRGEGFGLPPVEAMRAGCPVVSSCAPAMPEVLEDTPRYFDPCNSEELARELGELLLSPNEQAVRSRRGQSIAARYTVARMAEETVRVWREAA
ncbi:MAG: glycosyltransferase family 1 protein [Armatimonadaceae bacterium]